MKSIVRILSLFMMIFGLLTLASAADKTWTGQISDSMCGASHAKMIAAHGGPAKMTAHDCTLACVKAGGKYVFVTGGKVYSISNQDFAALQAQAGNAVRLTGAMNGDTITVSKVVASKTTSAKTTTKPKTS